MKSTKTPTNLRRDRTVRQLLSTVFAVALFLATMISPAYAVRFQDSDFYKGTMNLLQDVTLAITVIGPLVCAAFAGYYFVRKSMADDQDDKQWNRRIAKALICAPAIGLASGLITLLIGYYNPTTP